MMPYDARGQRGTGGLWSGMFPDYGERMAGMAARVARRRAIDPGWRVDPPIQGGSETMGRLYDVTQQHGE